MSQAERDEWEWEQEADMLIDSELGGSLLDLARSLLEHPGLDYDAGSAQRCLALHSSISSWTRGLLCASLVFLLHGQTDYALQIPSLAMEWSVLLGFGLALAAESRRTALKSEDSSAVRASAVLTL